MSRYIQQIVEYFFHHDVKGDIVTRVQQRILLGGHDAEDAFRKMWAECDEVVVDDAKTEKAFAKLSSALQNDTCDGGHLHWLKIAAIWLTPFIYQPHRRKSSIQKWSSYTGLQPMVSVVGSYCPIARWFG